MSDDSEKLRIALGDATRRHARRAMGRATRARRRDRRVATPTRARGEAREDVDVDRAAASRS